jgi:chromosome segregation protein
MIEQGRIDYILNADAEERRFLIEEAAGLSKYKVKKEEAVRKLERTEDNRLRLQDIIQEVGRNIQYAEKQARRAQRYQQQFEKLKRLEIMKAFYEQNGIRQAKIRVDEERSKLQGEMERLESGLQALRSEQESLTRDLRHVLDRFQNEDRRRYSLQSEWEQNRQQLKFNQEKRVEIAVRLGQILQEQTQIQERSIKNQEGLNQKELELQHFHACQEEVNT